jgi:hypothetical protein
MVSTGRTSSQESSCTSAGGAGGSGTISGAASAASRFLTRRHAPKPHSAAIDRNTRLGMPGIRPMMPSTAAATPSAFGWPNN